MLALGASCPFGVTAHANAAEVLQDSVTTVRARVIEATDTDALPLPGTDVATSRQTLVAEILKGPRTGERITLENDYVHLEAGDAFFLSITDRTDGGPTIYRMEEPDRLPLLAGLGALFILLVLAVGGIQGLRGLASLAGSMLLILFVLLPGILGGHSPVLVSIGVSALIVILGSYVTHGFNRTTSAAVLGMLATVLATGALAWAAVRLGRFGGYGSEEAVYLQLNMRGGIDLVGVLFGGIMIGLLGALYDVAIGQAVAVDELARIAPHVHRRAIWKRAMRIGREHIGALTDTLAIAYVGASLPLFLLFAMPPVNVPMTINREIFAAEIVRILAGSIGLVLAVPITTALAAAMLVRPHENATETERHAEERALDAARHTH